MSVDTILLAHTTDRQTVMSGRLPDYRGKAQSDDEAYLMRNAGDKLRQALADAGVAPR